MTNHFHLLVQTRQANLAEFMRHFNICYTLLHRLVQYPARSLRALVPGPLQGVSG
jgi:hypothetical protein